MKPIFNQEWTFSEVEEARLIIARFNNNNRICDEVGHDRNKKHDIVGELHEWFPWKTVEQVSDLYVDLVVEVLCQEMEYDGANGTHINIYGMDSLVNSNFGIPEEKESNIYGADWGFACPPEGMDIMESKEEAPVCEQDKVEVLENKMPVHQPVVAPYATRFWTADEHKLFLHGLRVFGRGRGKWKNISKYFVTTRTPLQISSHAQKYFKRIQSKGMKRQRHSINDVELDDVDPMIMSNTSIIQKALGSTDDNIGNPSSHLQITPFASIAQLELPYPKNVI
uniref:Uncharacterized protein n=1 Tax=Avena sativa TaxID=4498 RepID=A0ACD5YI53_AVESA